MIGPRQDLVLNGEGDAYQAARDVVVENHYHGLQLAEVETLVQLFVERQLPALREEALTVMKAQAQEFLREFAARLAQPNRVTQEAFAKPDSQVCFQEALKGSAEKGDQIDLALLAEMVIGRLESDNDPLIKLIYEDGVKVLPKLTGTHVAFLAYLMWMRSVRHTSLQNIVQLESNALRVLHLVGEAMGISTANKEYLVSLGVITINHVSDADHSFQNLKRAYEFLPATKEQLASEAPSLHALIDSWGKYDLPLCHLNGTGKLIGLLALQTVYGKVDLKIWLN
ncbi:hypothetical protein D9M68_575800 [compost metagenome]